MAQPLYTLVQKDSIQVRTDYLRTVSNGFISIGQPVPNVGPNSDYWITGTALGNEIAVGQANAVILADQLMPDTASGAYLDRWLLVFGETRRAATQSFGLVTIAISAASTLIVAGQQLVDSVGQLFEVTIGGLYGTAAGLSLQIPVQSVDGGKSMDHANGDTLRWVTAPAFCSQTVTVGTAGGADGLSGGADSEEGVDEPPRQRLFSRLQNPPRGGNAADIAGWASKSTPDVQACFVYPALQGPGTSFFAVTGAAVSTAPLSSTSKNRDLPATLVNSTVVPYVQGQASEHAFLVGVSVTNQPTDVALLLALPAAPTASPPGPGGGWLDGTPWPSTLGGTQIPFVSGVTSSTNFQVFLAVGAPGPTPGVTHIAYLSPFTWTLYTATVLTTVQAGNLWTITIDSPFPDISVGAFVFPQAVQQANYVTAMFAAFAQMGPGEWTTNAGALQRAFRHPTPASAQSWPYSLDANFLRVIEDAGQEVRTASFLYPPVGPLRTPSVPTSITVNAGGQLTSAGPSVLTPRQLGFYAS